MFFGLRFIKGTNIEKLCNGREKFSFWLSILGLRKFSSLNLMMNVDAHDVSGRVDDDVDVERLWRDEQVVNLQIKLYYRKFGSTYILQLL